MNDDTQIKHHLYWIMRGLGRIKPEEYKEFMSEENKLSEDVCKDIDLLVGHIKTNY